METNQQEKETQPKEVKAEVVKEGTSLEKATPGSGITLDSLALAERGPEILEARRQILSTARKHSIRLTVPEDWVLFREGTTGKETGFLQETGCQRIRDVWGINITPHEDSLRRIEVQGKEDFGYEMTGDGFCSLTQQEVKNIVGFRGSHEKFYTDITNPLVKEQYLRKGCRANLDGNIVRELAGMKVVPIEELVDAWAGTNKSVDRCALGRGYDKEDRISRSDKAKQQRQQSRTERPAASSSPSSSRQPQPQGDDPGIPEEQYPSCSGQLPGGGDCGMRLHYVPPGTARSGKPRGAYWDCAGKQEHADPKSYNHTVWHVDWLKTLEERAQERL